MNKIVFLFYDQLTEVFEVPFQLRPFPRSLTKSKIPNLNGGIDRIWSINTIDSSSKWLKSE
jgi:hypothetical protein